MISERFEILALNRPELGMMFSLIGLIDDIIDTII